MKGTSSIILLLAVCLSARAAPRFLPASAEETQEDSSNEARGFNQPADLIEAADASDPETYQLRHTLNMDGTRYAIYTKVKEDGSLEHQAAKVATNSFETKPLDGQQPEYYASTANPLAEASEQLLKRELGDGIQYMNEEASLNDTSRGPVYDCAFKVWNDSSTADSKMIYRVLPCSPPERTYNGNEEYMTCKFTTDQTLRQAILQKAELYLPQSNDKPPSNVHEEDIRSIAKSSLASYDDRTTQDPIDISSGNNSRSSNNPTDEASSIETATDEASQYKNVDRDQTAPPKEYVQQPPVNFRKRVAAEEKSAANDVRQNVATATDASTNKVVHIQMYRPYRKAPFQFDAQATDGQCGPAVDVFKMIQRWQRRPFDPTSIEIRLPMVPECGKTENCIDGHCLLPHSRVYLLIAYAEKVDHGKPATMAPEVMKEFLDIILRKSVLG